MNARATPSDGIAYIDGQYVPIRDAKISVLDWGFHHGDATYDVVSVWKGRFFRLGLHLDRFERSVKRLRMSLPLERKSLVNVLHECVTRSGLDDAYVEMICTRGEVKEGSRDLRTAENRLIVFAVPYVWIATPDEFERGLNLVVSPIHRIAPEAVDPTIKNYHWLDFTHGLFDAYDRGADTVVLVDSAGHITEGPGFNVFVVDQGRIATPDRGVLEGITRQTVIELCASLGFKIQERRVTANELRTADEVFLTSTAGGVMSIGKVDGSPLHESVPGPTTRCIHSAYWTAHADPRYSTPVQSIAP